MKTAFIQKIITVTAAMLAVILMAGCLAVPANAAAGCTVSVGDYFALGSYEQDGNTRNGKETLWWKVLAVEGDYALLLTENAIASRPFDSEGGEANWATCDLRSWLNYDFFYAAFSRGERSRIGQTKVTTCIDPYSCSPSSVITMDEVFLLSTADVEEYFGHRNDRICYATNAAADQGAYVADNTCGSWWLLRDGGDAANKAASVNSDGSIDYDGGKTNSPNGTVRPALWIYIGE